MQSFSLTHLTETEFEEFCYDLLNEMGFINMSWRKGTGLSSSPADRGRDIEGYLLREDVDGTTYVEKWFVECKHYEKGVPPEKIQGVITWATAERPNKVLIIASNFLSNPTKDYLENYKKNNGPPFEIKFWEKPNLERLTAGKSKLLRKYRVSGEFPHLAIMHPAHVLYMKELTYNSSSYFFRLLDNLDAEKRDKILSWVYLIVIKPRKYKTLPEGKSIMDLLSEEISYRDFKQKFPELAGAVGDAFLVNSLVNFTLQNMFGISDTTSIDEVIEYHKHQIAYLQTLKVREEDKDSLAKYISYLQDSLQNVADTTKENYSLYVYFCENVVQKLLVETIIGTANITAPMPRVRATGTVTPPNETV